MNNRIERIKKHFRDNKKTYIVTGVAVTVSVVTTYLLTRNHGNKATLVRILSPGDNNVIQIMIPPCGNAGNAVQHDQTGIVYPSQNCAAKALDLNPGNLSRQVQGKLPHVEGQTFTKLTINGKPIVSEIV